MIEPTLNEDFVDMLKALVAEHVEFVVVGAHALAAHGVVRSTGDLDLLVRPSAENAARVVAALKRFGAPVQAHGVSATDFAREGTVYQLGLPPSRIDLLTTISGVDFDTALAGSIRVAPGGIELRVLGKEEVRANKQASGRPKDLEDLRRLDDAE